MSSSTNSSLPFIGQQITIYGGIIIIITGVLGNLINSIVFLSLETFRQSSCAFYLIILSIFNIGQLLAGLLSRVMITGFEIDLGGTSLLYCKLRVFIFTTCSLGSTICLCLAIIDQYFATCTRPRLQQLSNIKIARWLIVIFLIISIIILIPYPIYLNHVTLETGAIVCTTTNDMMSQYRNYFVPLLLSGYIPDFITVLFGILAYRNVQQIAYRTVPLVRRELDKQLTVMVLVQVIINLFTNVPFVTMNALIYAIISITNSIITDIIQFIDSMLSIIFYTYFAVSRNVYD